jgi:hypothetical protein
MCTVRCGLSVTDAPHLCRHQEVEKPAWLKALMKPLFDSSNLNPMRWSLDMLDVMTQVDACTVDVDAMYSTTGIWVHGVPLPEVAQPHKPGAVKAWPSVMVYSLTNPDIGVRLFCMHTGVHVVGRTGQGRQAGAVRNMLCPTACCAAACQRVDDRH